MLVKSERLSNLPVMSMQAGGAVSYVNEPIIDPDKLKIVGFELSGGVVGKGGENILDVSSVREYASSMGLIVDSADEFVARDDVVKIAKVLDLNFSLIGLKVESKKGAKLGKVIGYTFFDNDFMIQQLIVKRPMMKSFVDSELVIPRKEVVEVNDYKVIVKDDAKTIKEKAETTDFVPNFVNPFKDGVFVGNEIKNLRPDEPENS